MELVESIVQKLRSMEPRMVVQREFYDNAYSSYLLKDFPQYNKYEYEHIHAIEKQIYFETYPRFDELPLSIQEEFYETLQIDSTLAAYEAMRSQQAFFADHLSNISGIRDELYALGKTLGTM